MLHTCAYYGFFLSYRSPAFTFHSVVDFNDNDGHNITVWRTKSAKIK